MLLGPKQRVQPANAPLQMQDGSRLSTPTPDSGPRERLVHVRRHPAETGCVSEKMYRGAPGIPLLSLCNRGR